MNPEDLLATVRQAALRVAGRLVGDTAAEDIAQETVLRAMPRLDEIARYAGPWAVRVATNLSLDQVRREARLSFAPLPEALAQAVDSELKLDLRKALGALPERQRQVVALRFLSDLDERTTADLLGISPGSAKRHLHRAMTTLRVSPHLIAPAAKEVAMRHWSDDFTAAIEPEGGWQERPWDHWRLESSFGRVSRIAVIDGDPVLDAEGDEVMEGPGFEFNVVKVLPAAWHDEPEPENRPVTSLPGLLGELVAMAEQESAYFGHSWVGDEHLALALAGRGAPGLPDLVTFELAVARKYDGPLAETRVTRVRARRAGEPFLRDPVPKVFSYSLGERIAVTAPDATAAELVASLRSGEYSLVNLLAPT